MKIDIPKNTLMQIYEVNKEKYNHLQLARNIQGFVGQPDFNEDTIEDDVKFYNFQNSNSIPEILTTSIGNSMIIYAMLNVSVSESDKTNNIYRHLTFRINKNELGIKKHWWQNHIVQEELTEKDWFCILARNTILNAVLPSDKDFAVDLNKDSVRNLPGAGIYTIKCQDDDSIKPIALDVLNPNITHFALINEIIKYIPQSYIWEGPLYRDEECTDEIEVQGTLITNPIFKTVQESYTLYLKK
jgi:hypothetical protein